MSASSSPQAPVTISSWLAAANELLRKKGIQSSRLDAQLILGFVLQRERGWLLAHGDEAVHPEMQNAVNALLHQRAKYTPLAYLFAYKEFYGRDFWVTPAVLIPRPETEELIEMALPYITDGHRIIDVGTGSGAIAVTLAVERPGASVEGCDISEAALNVARYNNKLVEDRVSFYQSDLLKASAGSYDMIVANLPYVAAGFEISPDARHEPDLALFADNEGYELIEQLIPQAARALLPGGYLLLESDPWQQDRIIASAASYGFSVCERRRFHLGLKTASPEA